MNRRAMLTRCWVAVLAVAMTGLATGCTLVGAGIGSVYDAGAESTPGPSAAPIAVAETAGDEEEWSREPRESARWGVASRPVLLDARIDAGETSGPSGSTVGAIVGAVIDVALVATFVAIASTFEFMRGWESPSYDSSGSSCTDLSGWC